MVIYSAYNKAGKELKVSCLSYGITPGMILQLEDNSFHTCNGCEIIKTEEQYVNCSSNKKESIFKLM
tara:strand:- start:14 stop:214 length:201 start_codon:yes stop_codon:yes gene_type:complete